MTFIYKKSAPRSFSQEMKNTPEDIGPGIYNITPLIGNKKPMKAPFGTKGDRSLYDPPKDIFPPPGSYEPKHLETKLNITSVFNSGSDRSDWFKRDDIPDPTSYSRQVNWTKKQYVKPFYKKPVPKDRPMTQFVGQNIEGFKTDKNGKWVPAKKYIKGPEHIGPGSYNPSLPVNRSIPISLGHTSHGDNFVPLNDGPGPGMYKIKGSINTNLNVSKWARSASRPSIFKSNTLDVDNYIGPESWVSDVLPSSTFKSKTERHIFPKKEETPDPTAYFRSSLPKPEYYDNSCFGVRAERKTLVLNNDIPGPGTYANIDGSNWLKSKSVSIHPHVKQLDTIYTRGFPGPGAYDDNRGMKPGTKAMSVFANKETRQHQFGTKINDVPGPGAYNPVIDDKNHQIPLSIHESKNDSRNNWINKTLEQNPSPDSYYLYGDKAKQITISPLGRFDDKPSDTPGPGSYDVLHKTIAKKSYNSAVVNLE